MSFTADKQTLDDLNITGKYKSGSMFSLFNKVHTSGGEKLLENMLKHPLSDAGEINKRSSIFKYFQQQAFDFPFTRKQFDLVEEYLDGSVAKKFLTSAISNCKKLVLGMVVRDQEYAELQTGLQSTIAQLKIFYEFISSPGQNDPANPYLEQIDIVKKFHHDKRLQWLTKQKDVARLSFLQLTRYDHLLRHTFKKEMELVMEVIYHLDVYVAVSKVAKEKCFSYAKALPAAFNFFKAEQLFHPCLKNAVGNTVLFNKKSNVIFLTGANMAGKSTLMKTFGIAVYMAHTGFPVAAKDMEFSVKHGLYSSINVPDNLNFGLSHFYAEVLRVKKVAQEVSEGKDMIVIFDELFKGTNVKDAYDATLAVTDAFSAYRNCFFVVSTHITEVGEALQKHEHISFTYLPTVMEGNVPRYTYKLKEGITADRQGMTIIENEGILDIIHAESKILEKQESQHIHEP